MPDSVVQGIANLVAIGLERSHVQDLAFQVEAARETEKLRTTLLDAMAHELKTPLTSIMAATTALLANPHQSADSKTELVRMADEETKRLKQLIEESLEMARMDVASIHVQPEPANVCDLIRDVTSAMRIENHRLEVSCEEPCMVQADVRLMKLAIRQL